VAQAAVKQTEQAAQAFAKPRYFGRIVGSPPGLPGGGITGVLPASGAGACISGSTPAGGHNTPSERASLSPSGSARWPVVVPSGTFSPEFGIGSIGAQLTARCGDGGAVWAGGVAGPGGACAPATSAAAIITHERRIARFIAMQGNGLHWQRFRNQSVAFCLPRFLDAKPASTLA
jgi:hypothetical protein